MRIRPSALFSVSATSSSALPRAARKRLNSKTKMHRTGSYAPNAFTWAIASAFAMPLGGMHLAHGQALPVNPAVTQGAANFATNGNKLTVTNTPGTNINWQSFNIGQNSTVQFVQQDAASMVFNRVTGSTPSSILGNLISNGQVFLINPNGVTIGNSARIDTAAFVASSLGISDANLLAGRLKFDQPGTGAVSNAGTIVTQSGGFVYFVGKNVSNSGVIHTPKGEIILAAGNTVEIINPKSPDLRVEITATGNEAVNLGKLVASGGTVGMFAGNVRQGGIAQASTAEVNAQGKIVLRAKQNLTLDAGSRTEASGPTAGTVTVQSETGTTTVRGSIEAIGTSTPRLEANLPQSQAGIAFAKENTITVTPDANGTGVSALLGRVNVFASPKAVSITPAQSAEATTVTTATATTGGKGGTVQILGRTVSLEEAAAVDASGETGGGTILVGGDFQGKNAEVQNARMTFVDANVILNADAKLTGDGGKVIVWADEATHFVGSISARGGQNQGNGGFAEVSGKDYLYFNPRRSVDLRALFGVAGTLLLDPDTILINGGPADANGDGTTGDDLGATTFTPGNTANGSHITSAAITAQMNNATVVLNAATSITVASAISAGAASGNGLTLNTATINLNASISTNNGAITLNGATTLGAAVTLSAGTSTTTFTGLITGGGNDLTLAGTGTNTMTGGATGLGTLTTTNLTTVATVSAAIMAASANVTLGAGVTTTGNQTYTGLVTLSADATLDAGANKIDLQGGADGGTKNLTLTSTNAAADAIKTGAAVTNTAVLGVNGKSTLGASVTTTGNQTYTGDMILATSTTLDATAGKIDLQAKVDASTAGTETLAVKSTNAAADAIKFGGVVGTTKLGALNVSGKSTINTASISTQTGNQTYSDAVTLGANTTLDAGAGNINFVSTVDGLFSLAANSTGSTTFGGAVGATNALTTLTTNTGGTVSLLSVTTSGAQTYGEDATLNGTYTMTNSIFSIAGNATLAGTSTISTGNGAITFSGTTDGGNSLTANSSTATTFAGAVGGTTALASLTTNAGGTVSLANVKTTGAQTYGETATLNGTQYVSSGGAIGFGGTVTTTAGTTFDATSGSAAGANISFANTVNGAFGLTVRAGTAGHVAFQGAIGGTAKPTSLNVTGVNVSMGDADITGAVNLTAQSGGSATLFGALNISGIAATATLAVDDLVLSGTINTVNGAAASLSTATAGRGIVLAGGAATDLAVSTAELAKITTGAGGTGLLTIGDAAHTGNITIAATTDLSTGNQAKNLTILNNAGEVAFNGNLTLKSAGTLNVSANAGTTPSGTITANGGTIFSDNVNLSAANGIGVAGSANVIKIGQSATINALTNTGTTGGIHIAVTAGDATVAGINSNGGAISVYSIGNMTVSGMIDARVGGTTGGNDITLVAGVAGTGATGFDANARAVASPTVSLGKSIQLNSGVVAGVHAGTGGGNIKLMATGAINQTAAGAAGVQTDKGLTALTFNDGVQVGVINLKNNVAGTGNAVGSITLEARNGTTASAPYASSNIDYKSINGVNISGLGTAADVTLTNVSQTIGAGTSLQGQNVKLNATGTGGGNGTITIATALDNNSVNGGASGGGLTLNALDGITLNGAVGTAGTTFDHGLTLVSGGSITVTNNIFIAPTRDLSFKANSSIATLDASGGNAFTTLALPTNASGVIFTSPAAGMTVQARHIDLGTQSVPINSFKLDGGGATANLGADASTRLIAAGILNLYTKTPGTTPTNTINPSTFAPATNDSGDVLIGAGTGIGQSGVGLPSTGGVGIQAGTWNIDVGGNFVFRAGTASAGGTANAIVSVGSANVKVGGNLVILGGNTTGNSAAFARFDPLNVSTGQSLALIGGTGTNSGAQLVNAGQINISVNQTAGFPATFTSSSLNAGAPGGTVNSGLIIAGGGASGPFNYNSLTNIRESYTPNVIPAGSTIAPITLSGGSVVGVSLPNNSSATVESNVPFLSDVNLSQQIRATNDETKISNNPGKDKNKFSDDGC